MHHSSAENTNISALKSLLVKYKDNSLTEREKGTYFEKLTIQYLKNEPFYADLYDEIYTYTQYARLNNLDARDVGIDLVAKTKHSNEYHAIQCKFFNFDAKINKSDIDSFFTASGKTTTNGDFIFKQRLIVTTCNDWSEHAFNALENQNPPAIKIDLSDLEKSQIDWNKFNLQDSKVILKPKKELRLHQQNALDDVIYGLKTAERGKLIMACGTGKTFTSLKIAEILAGKNKRVLFLVPSLALLSQTLTEWTQESSVPLHSFAVCSDSEVGKKKSNYPHSNSPLQDGGNELKLQNKSPIKKEEIFIDTFIHELKYPATTNAKNLALELNKRHDENSMSVVFSTYHSINVIHQAQNEYNLADFDLIICDEAHRTTGQTFDGEDDSNFTKIHDNDFIKGHKRLYMTATPRIYSNQSKAKADQQNIKTYGMDEEHIYGKDLHTLSFSNAVQQQLLVDYKVIVLSIDAEYVSNRIQSLLDSDNGLQVDDAAKIIGCWKALSKIEGNSNKKTDDNLKPMQRAVAFCQVIEKTSKSKTTQISSKKIASMFQAVVNEYAKKENLENPLKCEVEHVDGMMNASQKESKLNWIKEQFDENTCRILSNVRCLSEGVDVPALDAVLFLAPKNSQVDVVQSVGRVMRKAEGKKFGYVILPVVVPSEKTPEQSLDDNKTYAVVWQVLQALRSHDDSFDAEINKIEISKNSKIEVIAISDKITPQKSTAQNKDLKNAKGENNLAKEEKQLKKQELQQLTEKQIGLDFQVGEIEKAIYAKMVEKCGNRNFWQDWSNDVAEIANKHILRIKIILDNPNNIEAINAFNSFADELRDDLNDAITNDEVVEMLAQHLITKPVFEALFEDTYNFAIQNPISKAMQNVLDILEKYNIDKESQSLQGFYASVKMRASGIEDIEAKQKIIIELYDKFFRKAFPKMTSRLGIVYTPVEVVDFIIHSINDVLQQEFNLTLGDKNVHIIDPFTGTGTFITRLLQSGLISKEQLEYKYKHEIHANEIVLLAYYIATINIESVYHAIAGGEYVPFEGICLTDTFQMYEKEDLVSNLLEDNSKRRKRQKALNIKVIMGNPPYSVGQKNSNDNNANIKYPKLDESISNTYAKYSKANNKSTLYDSYIRAIRWASDRINKDEGGIIGFISGNGFIEKPAMEGIRKCLSDDFSSIYILNLRGDIRKNMLSQGRAKEGENIFGSGSMTGIAITIFVKNPNYKNQGKIYYSDIGDDLKENEKLNKLLNFKKITQTELQKIEVNKHNDWIAQREDNFSQFISIGDKKDKSTIVIFENYSCGVKTNRDAWCYNFSKIKLNSNMQNTINFYNSEVLRYKKYCNNLVVNNYPKIDEFINFDNTKISWGGNVNIDFAKFKINSFEEKNILNALYRPFTTNYIYNNRSFNERVYQIPKIFPNDKVINFVICLSSTGAQNAFTAFITNKIPDVHCIQNGQCFPLYLYEEIPHPNPPHTGEGIGTDGNLNLDLFSSLPSPSRRGAGGEVNSLIRKKLPPQMKEFARLLRKNQTTAESFLWENLRNKQMLGYKFRRQHIIANYIVDFYCHELKLVIELDGGQHAELEHKKADENRDKFLQQHGITVLRYWNNQVLDDNSSALEDIYNYIIDNQEIPHPNPPLIGEGIGTNYFNNLEENARNFSPHLEGEGLGEMSQTHTRKNAITDAGLKHFCDQYARNDFNKEDLFYYIYGLLHSNEYKTKYANNLSKELPRIPAVKSFEDFINFSKAGRKLADLHLNYENVPAHADVIVEYNFNDDVLDNKNYYVTSMKFGKNAQNSKEKDKTTIIYNDFITIKNIPLKAYEYIVNGKSAIDWVMDRQGVSTHKDSQIVNDANDWAIETMNDAKYPLKLLLSVIEVSMQTVDIVENLPKFEV